jgi:pilus assembly protein CpaC
VVRNLRLLKSTKHVGGEVRLGNSSYLGGVISLVPHCCTICLPRSQLYMVNIRRHCVLMIVTISLLFMLCNSSVYAIGEAHVHSLYPGETIVLDVVGLERAAIGDENVADVRVLSDNELMLNGITPGTTSLVTWQFGRREVHRVEVKHQSDLGPSEQRLLCAKIHASIGEPGVTVRFAGASVILEGYVKSQEAMNRAEKIALLYSDYVSNFLTVCETRCRILIEVQVVEMTKDTSLQLGVVPLDSLLKEGVLRNAEAFLKSLSMNIQEGSARVLSQPTLVVLEREDAELLVGGEVPIPVLDGDSTSIEWKEHGIGMTIHPVVDADGGIVVSLDVEVSSIDWVNGITTGGVSIPALRVRREVTRVKTYPHDLLVLGGLLQLNTDVQVRKLPILGYIPLVGGLFTNRDSTEKETELVILVRSRVI